MTEHQLQILVTVKELLAQRRRVDAVRYLRNKLDTTLTDAYKFMVAVESGSELVWPREVSKRLQVYTRKITRKRWREVVNEAHHLTTHFQRIQAVQLLRNVTGCGLKEALDATKRFKKTS